MSNILSARIISSLEKCFSDEAIETKPLLERISLLRGERLSFQLAFIANDIAHQRLYPSLRRTAASVP